VGISLSKELILVVNELFLLLLLGTRPLGDKPRLAFVIKALAAE
jgi:hypothetical protein